MNFNPFYGEAHWMKGNLHAHSTLSDGMCTPDELKQIYVEEGYSFIAYTDHNVFPELSRLNDDSFIAFFGSEIKSYPAEDNESCGDYRTYHMLCLAGPNFDDVTYPIKANEYVKPHRSAQNSHYAETQQIIDQMIERGCLVTINHPIWSRLLPEDICSLDRFFALEIYNSQCAIDGCDAGDGTLYWDLLLRQGKKIWGYAADDNHNKDNLSSKDAVKIDATHPRWPSCKGWVMVYAESLTQQAIATALQNGRFYSSTGPEIYQYKIVDNCVIVECSQVVRIDFITYDRRGYSFTDQQGLYSAQYQLEGDELYVRVQCTDRSGHCAWTNPIFLNQFSCTQRNQKSEAI